MRCLEVVIIIIIYILFNIVFKLLFGVGTIFPSACPSVLERQ